MVDNLIYHIVDSKWQRQGNLALQIALPRGISSLVQLQQQQRHSDKTLITSLLTAACEEPVAASNGVVTLQIPSKAATEVLQLLAATNRLHFRGKKIVCDFFGKNPFLWQVFASEGGILQVQGAIKTRQGELLIHQCDALGAGSAPWILFGISLRLLSGAVPPWNMLERLADAPIPADPSILDRLQAVEEKDSVIFLGDAYEIVNRNKDPLPSLRLTDRKGAFANLWMDYGSGKSVAYNDTAAAAYRRYTVEKAWEKDLLETDFIFKPTGSSQYYCPTDKVAKSLTFLLELGWKVFDNQNRLIVRYDSSEQGQDALSWEETPTALHLRGSLRYGSHNAAVADVFGAFNRRESFVSLSPDCVGLLPENCAGTPLEGIIDEVELIGDALSLQKRRCHLIDVAAIGGAGVAAPGQLRKLLARFSQDTPFDIALPASTFTGVLRPYQQLGINWLAFLQRNGFHGLLADDMGLGKTVQVLAFLSQLPHTADKPSIVVAPTSLLFNWRREVERFLPSLSPFLLLHHGPNRAADSAAFAASRLILTSYATLRQDLALLSSIAYECLIVDEAQAMKNSLSQTFRAVASLQANFRLSITGTPIENNLQELWSHFHFLLPELFPDHKRFIAESASGQSDPRYLQRIRKTIRPFILRRKKSDVASDLPEMIEQLVWVELHEEQRSIYETFLAGVRTKLIKKISADGVAKHKMELFEVLLRLRQICCDPILLAAQLGFDAASSSMGSKMELLLSDIATILAEGGKALVYSQFTSMLQLIATALRERGIAFAYLDGSTIDRAAPVTQFQEDPAIPLFLISLKAGGIGLNLTAADTVFLFDPWWNDAVEQQAIARAHRIGRQGVVVAKKFIAVETIEEKMVKLKKAKKFLAQEILDESEGGIHDIAALTVEDIAFLLS